MFARFRVHMRKVAVAMRVIGKAAHFSIYKLADASDAPAYEAIRARIAFAKARL